MKLVKLGQIFKMTSGGTPSRKNLKFYQNGDIPWIKTGDLKSPEIYRGTEYITKVAIEKSSAKLVPKDTVLIAMYGATIGATSVLKIEAATNQACCAFLPNSEVIPEYLYYFFKANKDMIANMGVGGAQPNISINILKNIKMPLVQLEKQEKIVSILNKSQELIDKRKYQIKALDELVKSRFIEMFGDPILNQKGWDTCELREGIKAIKYGASTPPEFSEEGISFVRATNIKFGRIIKNDMKYISADEAAKIEKCRLELGDTIVVRSGANTGDNAYVTEEYVGSYGGYDIIVRLNNEFNYVFLNAILNSSYRDVVIQPLTRRAGQPHLNSEQIQSLLIFKPPIELQNEFATFVNHLDKLKFEMQTSLEEMENNLDSLMQRAFKGELFN